MADEQLIDFREVGGIMHVESGADPADPAQQGITWNFGVMGRPGLDGPVIMSAAPNLYDVAPHAQGRWDGKTTICPQDAARKVTGDLLPAQLQPKGTCGGRSGKRVLELLQCVLIAAGRRAKFHKVSHAWPYALARMEYGMLGGGDGVPDGSIPPVLAKYGALHYEEAGETSDYGTGSDNLAAKWGGRGGPPKDMFKLASDNLVAGNLVKVRSFREMADGLAIGGVGVVSSMQGFDTPRNDEGVCEARGTWAHYMTVTGVFVGAKSGPCAAIGQSWGRNNPTGPRIENGRFSDYEFGAKENIIERMIRTDTLHMLFGFDLWDESQVIDFRDIV